jgi:ferredoxin
MSKVVVNDNCIGCGMCISISPEIFEMNDEGQAQVISGQEDSCAEAQDAIDMCPVSAIACS